MIVVVGMAFEARIAAGLGVPVVCGGDGKNLAASLSRAMAAGCGGLISFGVAGGLAPHLQPGHCIIGSNILDQDDNHPTDARWAQRLVRIIPGAIHGPIVGVSQPIAHSDAKRELHASTGALVVDMESQVVARAAKQHGVPMAAIRVVVDPVERTIPQSALAGALPDGTIDPLAVVRSLARRPRDLIGLIRMAIDTRAAQRTLMNGAALLGPGLGLLDAPYAAKGALALDGAPAPADA